MDNFFHTNSTITIMEGCEILSFMISIPYFLGAVNLLLLLLRSCSFFETKEVLIRHDFSICLLLTIIGSNFRRSSKTIVFSYSHDRIVITPLVNKGCYCICIMIVKSNSSIFVVYIIAITRRNQSIP
jgi:hypothetical protein